MAHTISWLGTISVIAYWYLFSLRRGLHYYLVKMSRSILKSSDSKRLIPIPANEGYANDTDYNSLNKVKPWSSVDEEPLMMKDIQNEMSNIHQNLAQMHEKMMGNFPQPPNVPMEPMMPLGPLPPLVPPPFQQPVMPNMLMPGPGPLGNIHHRNGSPNPGQMLAIRESGSPCGSLDRRSHHRGMQMTMPGQHPGGFGQGDIMIHAPPPYGANADRATAASTTRSGVHWRRVW